MSHIIITVAVVQLQLSPEGKSLTVPAIPFLHIGKSPYSSDKPNLPFFQTLTSHNLQSSRWIATAQIWVTKTRQSEDFFSEHWNFQKPTQLESRFGKFGLSTNLPSLSYYASTYLYKPLSQLGILWNSNWTRLIARYKKLAEYETKHHSSILIN